MISFMIQRQRHADDSEAGGESETKYFSAAYIADLAHAICVLNPSKALRNDSIDYKSVIREAIIKNEIDSIKIAKMKRGKDFAKVVGNRRLNGIIGRVYSKIRKEFKMEAPLVWPNVLHAISQEMEKEIVNRVSTLTADMNYVTECTAQMLMYRLTFQAKKSLTNAETEYLRALLNRAVHFDGESTDDARSS